MALRDQPYLPLYVQDFLTDEKLTYCSAAATGVYIRLMCVMHKSEPYGTIRLKNTDLSKIQANKQANFKQTDEQIKIFALQVARFLPYDLLEVSSCLCELLNEGVLQIDGDLLVQKRMLKDGETSNKRALAGSCGGKTSQQNKANNKANTRAKGQAKNEQNTEIENEIDNVNEINNKNELLNKLIGGDKKNKMVAINQLVNQQAPQFNDPNFFIAWADWEQTRKEKNTPITPNVARLSLKKLFPYSLPVAIEILQLSATNGWTGLFPEKIKQEKTKPEQYETFLTVYKDFYKKSSGELYPAFAKPEEDALLQIMAKLDEMCKAKQTDPVSTWAFILLKFDLLEDFYKKQIQITDINKNFTNIINQIRQKTNTARAENDKKDYSFNPNNL